jgi:hypothetical protein
MSGKVSQLSETALCSSASIGSDVVMEPTITTLGSGTEQQTKVVHLSAEVTVTRVCLSLVDKSQEEVARIEMKELQGNAHNTPGNISGVLSLQDLLVAVAGKHFIVVSMAEATTEKALDLRVDNPKGGAIKVVSLMSPIVVFWRKEDVAAFVAVAEACVPVRMVSPPTPKSPAEARRASRASRSSIRNPNRTMRRYRTFNIGPESCALASAGLDRTSEFPLLQTEKKTD